MTTNPESSVDAGFQLLSDEPYLAEADPLGYDQIATHLEQLVGGAMSSTPFSVGIRGDWGTGKSTLMRKLHHRLEARGAEVVWFNAWTSEGGSALQGLMSSTLEAIDPSTMRRSIRRIRSSKGLRLLAATTLDVLRLQRIANAIWGTGDIWSKLASDEHRRNEAVAVIRDAVDRWSQAREGTYGKLLVVFIDDLDRCSTDNVFEVFEALKLYLNVPGFVFVLGYDPTQIQADIDRKRRYEDPALSLRYLEKIVQVDYRIPRPSDDQINELVVTYTRNSHTERLLRDAEWRLVVRRNRRNPRRIKRFINRFILEFRGRSDPTEIDPESLVRLLMLRDYFEDFWTLILEGGSDPIQDFVDFQQARSELEAGLVGQEATQHTITRLGGEPDDFLDSETGPSAAREFIDANIEESFITADGDPVFVSLIDGIEESAQRPRLLERARGAIALEPDAAGFGGPEIPPRSVSGGDKVGGGAPLAGMRILWVDDNPPSVASLIDALASRGAEAVVVGSHDEAVKHLLSSAGFDVIISDISRMGPDGRNDREAGFNTLRLLREEQGFEGDAVFYTSRLTANRRKVAEELGATITNRPHELMSTLERMWALPAKS